VFCDYTNRIFFTYLYLDNTTGMTHLKIRVTSLHRCIFEILLANVKPVKVKHF